MAINSGYPERMLFALLRAALHQHEVEVDCFREATENNWRECFSLAVRQGVAALAWSGIERLPADCAPPLNVKLSWALKENEQKEIYRKHCQAATEITKFLAEHGIATVVLKGIGLSRIYPVPEHREGGDIDIYTYSADRSRMTDEQANQLADKLLYERGAVTGDSPSKKHSKCRFNGVTIENHRMFLHVAECETIAKAEQWLKEHISTERVQLLDGGCCIEVPSTDFDSVFIPMHAAQHHGNGLSLKHLCDWILLLKHNGMKLPAEPEDKYFRKSVNVLTQLCNHYLGLEIPVAEDNRLAEEMMQEIMHPPYFKRIPEENSIRIRYIRLMNRIHIFRLKHRLLGVSFWGKFRGLLVRKITKRGRA